MRASELRNNRSFINGLLMGIVAFLIIYGVAVLDVMADGWIFKSDVDLRQHYLGWMAYRDSSYSFPVGMTDKLSYPHEMSIVYTDSIPLLAFACKCLSPYLPRPFQYFGWYALLCYALTGAYAGACLSKLVKNKLVIEVCTFFCVLSYPLLFRTFYHTSLSSQWLILMCFYMVLSGLSGESIRKQTRRALTMGELCAGIHLYFLPMAAIIILAGYVREMIAAPSKKKQILKGTLASLFSMAMGAVAVLWIMGAFNFPSGNGNYWVGDFTMNLNSLINPLGHSVFLPSLPLYTSMQFEGAIYPGLGVLALTVFCLVRTLFRKFGRSGAGEVPGKGAAADSVYRDENFIIRFMKEHPLRFSFAMMALILVLSSVSPVFAFGDRLIFSLPYPVVLSRILGIFRSNGRFIWPVLYLLIFALAKCTEDILGKGDASLFHKAGDGSLGQSTKTVKAVSALLLVCLVLQAVDFSGWIVEKQGKYYMAQKTYRTVWDELDLPDEVWSRFDGFVNYEDDTSFNMGTAYFAMRHELTVNSFYFARDIDEKINETRDGYTAGIMAGEADPGKIYVLDRETYERFKDTGLHFYKTRKCVFGVKNEIEELEELKAEDLDEISFR